MKHHDERIYRRPAGRPSLQSLESQLVRCREDYERMASKDISEALRTAMRERITALEADIARIKRAATQEAAGGDQTEETTPNESTAPVAPGGLRFGPAGTRAIPPRFRPRRDT